MAPQTQLTRLEQAQFEYFNRAKELGVPADAIRRFTLAGYVPQTKQLEFHAACRECDQPNGPSQIGFGGARGPGKSHALFAQVALDDCQRFEGLKVLYLRKVAKNAREQFEDLRRSVLRNTQHEYKRQEGIIYFDNGSRILIGHFKNESDIDAYLGLEYDIIVIEEATMLTVSKYKTLRDSNRTSKEGFRPRLYCSTNPGGVGHAWFKERFIKPARDNQETDTRFIFATVDDNTFLDQDYTKKLEENTGWKLKAYRYGDWDIAAGQYFSNWDYDSIVKDFPDPLPHHLTWGSLDYGFIHPTTAYLYYEFDARIRVVDEFRARKQLPQQNAEGIIAMFHRHGVEMYQVQSFCAGRDVFGQRGAADGRTIGEQYEDAGITLTPANDDRISGAAEILQRFGDKDRGIAPLIEIHPRCSYLINSIPSLQHNPHKPEDVLKVNADDDGNGGDDEYDGFRYGVMEHARIIGGGEFVTGVPYSV